MLASGLRIPCATAVAASSMAAIRAAQGGTGVIEVPRRSSILTVLRFVSPMDLDRATMSPQGSRRSLPDVPAWILQYGPGQGAHGCRPLQRNRRVAPIVL